MVQAIQVLRFHLLELEKVSYKQDEIFFHYLCEFSLESVSAFLATTSCLTYKCYIWIMMTN